MHTLFLALFILFSLSLLYIYLLYGWPCCHHALIHRKMLIMFFSFFFIVRESSSVDKTRAKAINYKAKPVNHKTGSEMQETN